jgi:hypothetical protein
MLHNLVTVVLIELDIPFMDGLSTTRAIRQLDESGSPPAPLFTLSNVAIIGVGHIACFVQDIMAFDWCSGSWSYIDGIMILQYQ